jgi:hypothetical protein
MTDKVKVSLCMSQDLNCKFQLKEFCFVEMLGGTQEEAACVEMLKEQAAVVNSSSMEGEVSAQA